MPAAAKCPICRKPALADYRPFCSKRCANVDLSRWLGEVYTVPAAETDDQETWSEEPQPTPRNGG